MDVQDYILFLVAIEVFVNIDFTSGINVAEISK